MGMSRPVGGGLFFDTGPAKKPAPDTALDLALTRSNSKKDKDKDKEKEKEKEKEAPSSPTKKARPGPAVQPSGLKDKFKTLFTTGSKKEGGFTIHLGAWMASNVNVKDVFIFAEVNPPSPHKTADEIGISRSSSSGSKLSTYPLPFPFSFFSFLSFLSLGLGVPHLLLPLILFNFLLLPDHHLRLQRAMLLGGDRTPLSSNLASPTLSPSKPLQTSPLRRYLNPCSWNCRGDPSCLLLIVLQVCLFD